MLWPTFKLVEDELARGLHGDGRNCVPATASFGRDAGDRDGGSLHTARSPAGPRSICAIFPR